MSSSTRRLIRGPKHWYESSQFDTHLECAPEVPEPEPTPEPEAPKRAARGTVNCRGRNEYMREYARRRRRLLQREREARIEGHEQPN